MMAWAVLRNNDTIRSDGKGTSEIFMGALLQEQRKINQPEA